MMYEESPLLSPTTDFIFKRIFGNEEGKIGLISLLNAILNGDPVVKDLKFLNTEPPKDEIYTKASRLDVEAKTDNGTIVNVEIQCVDTGDLDDRAITYESQLIGQYTRQGSNYKEPNVISIWIIRDQITHGTMVERNCPIEHAFVHLEENTWCKKCTRLSNRFKIIFIHLSRFKDDKLLEPLSELMIDWAKFFIDKPENVKNSDKGMNDAQHIWTKVAGDKVVKDQIKAIEKYEMDKRSEITIAKMEGLKEGKEEGLKEGEKKGIKKGLKEGEKKGIKKGREEGLKEGEHKKAIETAKNFLKMGLSVEQVSNGTGLTIEEVKELV